MGALVVPTRCARSEQAVWILSWRARQLQGHHRLTLMTESKPNLAMNRRDFLQSTAKATAALSLLKEKVAKFDFAKKQIVL